MKEFEIRPKALFDDFLEISKNDIKTYFSDFEKFIDINCPCCDSDNYNHSFIKNEFSYCECTLCGSVFVSPRPSEEMINKFYAESPTSKFWATRFFPETEVARKEKIFKPRADKIASILKKLNLESPIILADIGSGYGSFLEEIDKLNICDKIIGIEPSYELARCCIDKGFSVIQKPIELIAKSEINATCLTSFELIEHLFNPFEFLSTINQLLDDNGILIFTTLTISGFDLLVLGEKSKSISPPHHINFMTTEGLEILMDRSGFKLLELETPGELDVDIVQNMIKEGVEINLSKFESYLLNCRDKTTLQEFQEFLKRNKLSSHVRVIAQK